MARTGLGRGLDVLLGQAPGASAPTLQSVGATEIPLERIRPNPEQPRSNFDADGIAELAASITRRGVLQPIVVAREGDAYELGAGHCRVRACGAARTTE